MVLQYDVPVFLFHPDNREKVRESFGYITRYAAAVSGTLMWQHVYPDYNEQVRRSGEWEYREYRCDEAVDIFFRHIWISFL